jgi:hypothetical protein
VRFSEQDYANLMLKKGQPIPLTNPKPSKYRAVMEECRGIKFQSKKEARYFRELYAAVHNLRLYRPRGDSGARTYKIEGISIVKPLND